MYSPVVPVMSSTAGRRAMVVRVAEMTGMAISLDPVNHGREPVLAQLVVVIRVFHHDDGVVHQEPDAQHQGKPDHVVVGQAEDFEQDEGQAAGRAGSRAR